ncbi:MAG: iron-sulfur cluster repair di-iron protein [Deltaproteobacteria bacterium]|nr:iron-sulfur cluster repair di-iron protein [Deltaproteobacteria bacterium]TLN05228.1 MAG: iron-sulfur cluster repair di-iron protein [bacterium]
MENQHSDKQLKDSADRTIGEIVADDYRTARVFEDHGIDFCCGGKIALSAICRDKGIELAVIEQELAAVKVASLDRSLNYSAWELPFLVDFIVNTHHAYLHDNMEQIAGYTRKIAEVHGSNHPEVQEIAEIFSKMVTDLTDHLQYEEGVFFPSIKRCDAAGKSHAVPDAIDLETIRAGLEKLQQEHEEVGDAIHRIRHLARDYEIPGDACNTFMLTYQKLEEFEDDLHKHVHLENNILFPKAAQLFSNERTM